MSFTATEIQFLQRLVRERPAHRRGGAVANFFSEHYSIGRMAGRNIEYREADHASAASLLRTHDLPVQALDSTATRADVALYGGVSEKHFSKAPHANSVAIKFIGRCSLAGQPLVTPAGAFMVLYPDVATQVSCDRILVVENFETFRRLEDYRWISYEGQAVMVVFRGDPSLPVSDALGLVRRRREPIWAFVDFDPSGLLIANSLPHERLEKLVLPTADWLTQASDGYRGRQLFSDQYQMCADALDVSNHPQVKIAWAAMRQLQGAVTQERMQQAVYQWQMD